MHVCMVQSGETQVRMPVWLNKGKRKILAKENFLFVSEHALMALHAQTTNEPHFLLIPFSVSRCGITAVSCRYLAKVLCSVSHPYPYSGMWTGWQAVELVDVDLSMNNFGDAGIQEISAGLKNPYSHLKTLKWIILNGLLCRSMYVIMHEEHFTESLVLFHFSMSYCGLTDDCCAELASGLGSNDSIISELDLSGNVFRDKGVRKLCTALKSLDCNLEKLS